MTVEEHEWERHWQGLTYPQRLRFLSVLFDEAQPNDVVWMTHRPFVGYRKWRLMRWDDVC